MSIVLPPAIASYFAAESGRSAEEFSQRFTPNAVVEDDGAVHTGREAIRQWKVAFSKKFTFTAEPIALTAQGDETVVTSHVVGNFPGSPLDLRYRFVVDGELISRLEITL